MMSVIRRRAAGLALATTLLVAAACGDDGDDAAAPADRVSAADNPPDAVEVDEAALQALLEEWRTDVDAYGATLSIRVPGHDDVHLASGVDDRDPDTPMTTDGTYGIGTITRTFVAAAALSLVDAGELSLDEPVEPWLPELPATDETTLAMLLGFTSGAAQLDDATEQELILADLTRQFTPDEVLALHVEQPPAAPPGDEFAYNTDTGYVAAGLLVERELDQDLATVIEERFAQPLGLDEAYVSSGAPKPTRHQWFSLDGEPDRPLDTLDFPGEATSTLNWASRNMVSSSEHLLAWAEALYTGRGVRRGHHHRDARDAQLYLGGLALRARRRRLLPRPHRLRLRRRRSRRPHRRLRRPRHERRPPPGQRDDPGRIRQRDARRAGLRPPARRPRRGRPRPARHHVTARDTRRGNDVPRRRTPRSQRHRTRRSLIMIWRTGGPRLAVAATPAVLAAAGHGVPPRAGRNRN
jgi:CubicO group peptidase (beta-lactamase class C family)